MALRGVADLQKLRGHEVADAVLVEAARRLHGGLAEPDLPARLETGTFAVLATIPATFLTELGFAVAFGILLDTIIVRSVLVTALNLDIGRWMWWPSKLKDVPDVPLEELKTISLEKVS